MGFPSIFVQVQGTELQKILQSDEQLMQEDWEVRRSPVADFSAQTLAPHAANARATCGAVHKAWSGSVQFPTASNIFHSTVRQIYNSYQSHHSKTPTPKSVRRAHRVPSTAKTLMCCCSVTIVFYACLIMSMCLIIISSTSHFCLINVSLVSATCHVVCSPHV